MPQAHKRLMDCHAQWHVLQESYFDPDGFRLALNAFLQTHRSVTTLLLKHNTDLPGFEEWFTEYTNNAAKADVMKWAKKSRNRVVHESDLDIDSSCRVTWVRDWYTKSEVKAEFPPRMNFREILKAILNSRGMPPFGTITITRRWVDRALSSWEILDATAASYMHLNSLLRIGHQFATVDICDLGERDIPCVDASLPVIAGTLPCMHAAQSHLSAHFSVPDGDMLSEDSEELEIDETAGRAAFEKYNIPEFPSGDAIDRVPGFMDVARRIMEKDGNHGTFAFLFSGDGLLQIQAMVFSGHREKMLSFEGLARLVESTRADGVLLIGEMWVGSQTNLERKMNTVFIPPRDRLDRTEALSVYAITRDGRQAEQICLVERGSNGEAHCSEPIETESGLINTMIPIRRRWKDMEDRGI